MGVGKRKNRVWLTWFLIDSLEMMLISEGRLQMLEFEVTMARGPEVPAARVFATLSHLADFYPRFEEWYWAKVVPGLQHGSRRIFFENDGRITGVVIAKRSRTERKLCTVWVDTGAVGRGLGTTLMTEAMAWLDTKRPLVTVPEERVSEFESIFRRWRFSLDEISFRFRIRPGTSGIHLQ